MKILLVCCAGMSTSLLVTKMQEAAKEIAPDSEIWAVAEAEAGENWQKADILLLGPQVRYLESKIKSMVDGNIPVSVIDMRPYGMMDGKTILTSAISDLESFQK